MVNNFIQKAHLKKGALHKQLGYPEDYIIPEHVLHQITKTPIGKKAKYYINNKLHTPTITRLLKRRAQFALNIRR